MLFLSRWNLPEDEIKDIYQESMIALFENARKGKLDGLKSSLSTYLYAIGKYLAFRRLKKLGKQEELDADFDFSLLSGVHESDEDEENADLKSLVAKGLSKMGEVCREVLRLFYYEEKSLDEICGLLNYPNKNVVKSQKSRCLAQLKKLCKEMN